jgi:beta-1,4-galactosyltransferase 1
VIDPFVPTQLQHYPSVAFYLLGTRIVVNKTVLNYDQIENELRNRSILTGGRWYPKECIALYRVAIIVPYRNRENNLKIFLRHIHPFLAKQQLDYGIYVVEPQESIAFNRALLMNIGFAQALNLTGNYWKCFVFHDVDLIPEEDRNIYSCPEAPRHLSSAVSTFNYKLPYEDLFGGVTSFTKEQFEIVNGFSNLFFGWGGEGKLNENYCNCFRCSFLTWCLFHVSRRRSFQPVIYLFIIIFEVPRPNNRLL